MQVLSIPAPACEPWSTFHPLTEQDRSVMAALRSQVALNKGRLRGPAARASFDAIIGHAIARRCPIGRGGGDAAWLPRGHRTDGGGHQRFDGDRRVPLFTARAYSLRLDRAFERPAKPHRRN